MKDAVLAAFLETRDGHSADAVITDSKLNGQFLLACARWGCSAAAFELNHCLYNLRKQGALQDHATIKRTRLKNQDDYRFAVEIAARFLERKEKTSLDRIICDPALAMELGHLASQLAPGFSSFEYRFTALSLRKRRRLQPEIVARVIAATRVEVKRVRELSIESVPRGQGIYMFFFKNEGVLYLGEAKVLRDRIRKHLDHSDRKELARWLWDHGSEDLFVEFHLLPDDTTTTERKAVELELIRSRKPRFNILGVESSGG